MFQIIISFWHKKKVIWVIKLASLIFKKKKKMLGHVCIPMEKNNMTTCDPQDEIGWI